MRGATNAAERERIIAALNACAGNQSRAAKLLGIPRRTFLTKLDGYGIPRPKKGCPATTRPTLASTSAVRDVSDGMR